MRTAALLLALALVPTAFPAMAATEAVGAVAELGRINGLALACQQPALSSRARNAVATVAAKTREYGETFENATSAAFLAQGKGVACPDAATLNQELQAAEQRLQAAFPPGK